MTSLALDVSAHAMVRLDVGCVDGSAGGRMLDMGTIGGGEVWGGVGWGLGVKGGGGG